jgi:DNA-binding MarR family transcriptional regulator
MTAPPPPPDGVMRPAESEPAPASGAPGHKDELRLWLRLLATTNLIEAGLRRRLRTGFDTTLPRFDLLAQLHRAGGALTLGAISRRMMVSNGNVTGIAARLVADGLVERRASEADRRAQELRLTARGRREFARWSAAHEEWVAEIFAGLTPEDRAALFRLLARAKASARAAIAGEETGA